MGKALNAAAAATDDAAVAAIEAAEEALNAAPTTSAAAATAAVAIAAGTAADATEAAIAATDVVRAFWGSKYPILIENVGGGVPLTQTPPSSPRTSLSSYLCHGTPTPLPRCGLRRH